MINKSKTGENMAVYIPSGELIENQKVFIYTFIIIIDKIKRYIPILNGFQNVC